MLNGSPRPDGNTKKIDGGFPKRGGIRRKYGDRHRCLPEKDRRLPGLWKICHTEGRGSCIQKDDMQQVYDLLRQADMLVLASPIYYHGLSGQLKCAIDRFYSAAYPQKPQKLSKVAMILSSAPRTSTKERCSLSAEIFWIISVWKIWGFTRRTAVKTALQPSWRNCAHSGRR